MQLFFTKKDPRILGCQERPILAMVFCGPSTMIHKKNVSHLQSTPQKSVEVKCDMLKYLTQNGWLWSKKGPQKPTGEPNDFHQIRKKPTY